MNDNQKFLLNINLYWIYFIGFLLIAFQPINILPPWFTPTDWGKALIFRMIMAVLAFLFISQILYRKISISYVIEKIKLIFWPFLILASLFGVFLLATVFSVDSHFSLWGDPGRNGGFVNFAFYILFSLMIFLIIKKDDWKKIFDFSIFIGIIVCLVAIFQQFGLFGEIIMTIPYRPVSTMGNTILLSLYLLLLTYITFALGIREKNTYKKIFYFFSAVFFIIINVFSAETRGTIGGLGVGFLFFLFGYPGLPKKIRNFGIIALVILISIGYGAKLYMDSHLYVYSLMPTIMRTSLDRTLSIFEGAKIMGSRISAWKVSWEALKEKPILGYGPENFMIGFDKHYNSNLVDIGAYDTSGDLYREWWNRAHNILFDIALSAGIPAMIIYVSLFIILIWQLQKSRKRNPENALMAHALQATFIGYFISLLFSFDSVSTYLIFFFLIGYSLYIISTGKESEEQKTFPRAENIVNKLFPYRLIISALLFIILVFFIYAYNIVPLRVNKEMNVAMIYADNRLCPDAFESINKIYPQIKGNIIDNYLGLRSIFAIYGCIRNNKDRNLAVIDQAIQIMGDSAKAHPAYVQNWLLLGEFNSILIEQKNNLTNFNYSPTEEMEAIKDEANSYFQKAHELSPGRPTILMEWAKLKILTDDFKGAEEKLNECFALNKNYIACIWGMALAKGYAKDLQGFKYYYNLATEKNYRTGIEESQKQLVDMFIRNGDYVSLVEPYQKLIAMTSDSQKKAQLHAALAATYVELKQYSNAKKEAQKILELIPSFPLNIQEQARKEAEAFINGLGK